ncbi:hypothetical protein MCEGE10_01828 [Flavobacteriaceae bacterium]
MKKEISKKYILYFALLPLVRVFGTNPPPIGDAPPPPGFPIDGEFILVTLGFAVVYGIYKLKLKIAKN